MTTTAEQLVELAMAEWQCRYPDGGITGFDMITLIARMVCAAVEEHERTHHAGEARTL
jgi:hypothetical protein